MLPPILALGIAVFGAEDVPPTLPLATFYAVAFVLTPDLTPLEPGVF